MAVILFAPEVSKKKYLQNCNVDERGVAQASAHRTLHPRGRKLVSSGKGSFVLSVLGTTLATLTNYVITNYPSNVN
jgi:hypothetical protein